MFPPVWQLAFNISPTFSSFPPSSFSYPLSLPPLPSPPREPPSFLNGRVTPHENVTAAILSYAVSHLHEGTGKLRKTCADIVGHLTESVPSLTVSEKWPPAKCFDVQAADRRSSIQVLTERKAAWLGWSPGTGHLPHTEHCRLLKSKEIYLTTNKKFILVFIFLNWFFPRVPLHSGRNSKKAGQKSKFRSRLNEIIL